MAYSKNLQRKLDKGYRDKQIIAMVMNFVSVAFVMIAFVMNLGITKHTTFSDFLDPLLWSPILAVIGAIVMAATQIRYIARGIEIPKYAKELKLVGMMAMVSMSIMYLMSIITSGPNSLSMYIVVFGFILAPVLMIVSFLLEGRPKLTIASAGKAIIPQVLMSIAVIVVSITSMLKFLGYYPFELQDLFSEAIYCAIWIVITFLVALGLIQLSQKIDEKTSR